MSDSPRKPFGHAKSSGSVPRPAPKAPPPPAFEVVDDEPADDGFEVIEEAPKKKAVKAEAAPVAKKVKQAEPDEDDEPMRTTNRSARSRRRRKRSNWTICPANCSRSRTRTKLAATRR